MRLSKPIALIIRPEKEGLKEVTFLRLVLSTNSDKMFQVCTLNQVLGIIAMVFTRDLITDDTMELQHLIPSDLY